MWVLLAFGSAFFAAVTTLLAKVGLQGTDSTTVTALRTGVVLIFSWIMVAITGSWVPVSEIGSKALGLLALSGLATGGSWLAYFRALQLGDIHRVAPIDKSSTVLTMLLAALLLQEKLTWLKIFCILLIAAGTLLMVWEKSEKKESKKGSWLLWAILSAVLAALTAILGKLGMESIPSNLGTALRTCVVLIMAWVMVSVTGKGRSIREISKRNWLFILLSGLATGASWLCYYRALQLGPASVVVPIDKLSILFTVGFAWLFMKERASLRSMLGLLIMTAGTLLLLL